MSTRRRWRTLVLLLAVPFLLWTGSAAGLYLYGTQLGDPEGHYEAIVVAGATLDAQGNPSEALRRRVARAVALWQSGVAPIVVFTGGRADARPRSEAAGAAAFAAELGLPTEAARLEEASTSTRENATLTASAFPYQRIVIVTDDYHLFRAERVFRRVFAEAAPAAARAPVGVAFRGALREVLALGWYALRGWL